MEYSEIKNKSEKELHDMLAELRAKLQDLTFRTAQGQLNGVREVRETKKTIARLLTSINSRDKIADQQ